MNKLSIFLIIIFLTFLVNCDDIKEECSLTEDIIKQQILEQQVISCLKKALKNNWLIVIDYLIKEKKADYQQKFIKVFQNQIKRLQILEEQIVLGTSETQPILKWGQNKTHVFISFKLSHRWDSPPCLYTQFQVSELNSIHLFYKNICLVSHQKVNFKLDFDLFKNVIPNIQNATKFNQTFQSYKFQVKKDGVGTYSTILLKETPQIWLFLTNKNTIYPSWLEIGSRYPDDDREYQMSIERYKQLKNKVQSNNPSSQSQL